MRAKGALPVWAWVVAPAAVLLVAVALLALVREGDRADADARVGFGDVAENPRRFYGETVTVSGAVGAVLGPRSLLIGDRFVAADLVVSSTPLRETLDEAAGGPNDVASLENNDVWVTGEVRRLDLTEAEQETGANLEREALDAYAGNPAIIADSVALEPPESADKDGAAGEES